ncbi:hypothetical protein PP568_06775 [Mycobacteroides abscessus]|uniref:Uncharacterized protein n=1 Tax=Mycobacteroides abscessus subsp. abscessus TaxID=1185650 RepID=A0AB38D2Q4_9MYCO|nr:hypothetical protein [Mycobacteroides abscessus]MBE5419559.1 hypothetical protein [Mycobacteroides abscessus]MBE5455742.1 hypothetical protein [Mycobacteroides abscessus]MBN7463755.1 hypothetical protein [Mycobacteroides abscessus subsp. abscessus]MBN7555242.1 hypothetical protein [Mycobacteroides abscessus subsp. abscessus]MDM2404634.1 hypothetical protein [Mycobacteroides abscessus]
MTTTIARVEAITAEAAESSYELVLRGLHIHAADGVITLTDADLGGFVIDRYTTGEEREEIALTLTDNGYELTWTDDRYPGNWSLTGDMHGFLTHLQRTFTDTGYDL